MVQVTVTTLGSCSKRWLHYISRFYEKPTGHLQHGYSANSYSISYNDTNVFVFGCGSMYLGAGGTAQVWRRNNLPWHYKNVYILVYRQEHSGLDGWYTNIEDAQEHCDESDDWLLEKDWPEFDDKKLTVISYHDTFEEWEALPPPPETADELVNKQCLKRNPDKLPYSR